ncbi:MAG: hypothetical protein ACRDG9_04330, partial [Actinomycetota bacterium]
MGKRQVHLAVVAYREVLGARRRQWLEPVRIHAQEIGLVPFHEQNDARWIRGIGKLEPEEVDDDKTIQANERHLRSFLDHDPLGRKRRQVDRFNHRCGRGGVRSLTSWRYAVA